MKVLLIENQPYASQIKSKRDDITVYDGSLSQSVEVVAEDIKTRYGKHADVFIIDIHLQIGNAQLSENAGIKLLKLLRLHYIDTHVVLYSWMSREMLMSDLRNAIIFSKGVSFCRLPDFLNAIQDIDFSKLSHETAEKNELLQLFRAEYDPNDSHFDANVFGVWQLVKAQEAYERLCGINTSIEDDFKEFAVSLKTYHALLAQYVNKNRTGDLEHHFLDELSFRNERVVAALKRSLPKRIENRINGIENLQKSIEDKESKEGKEEGKDNAESSKQLMMRKAELYEQEILMLKNYLNHIQSEEIIHGKTMLSKDPDPDGCCDVREQLKRISPKIVFVDDMADQGWSDILQRIIYGGESLCFQKVVPQEGESPEKIANRVFLASKPAKDFPGADLIILDIRLKNEHGYYKPSMLSGFKVLSSLVHRTNCPILMFTASNKVWSFQKAIKSNALSFWTKGSLDNWEKDIAKDYFNLIDQIHSLVSIKWICKLIADIKDTVRSIKATLTPFWWETYKAGFLLKPDNNTRKDAQEQYYERNLTSKTTIVDLLNNVTTTMMKGLRSLFTRSIDLDLNTVCCIMVLQLSFVLDEIHRSKGIGPKEVEPSTLQTRMSIHLPQQDEQQNMVRSLCKLRNIVVHRGGDAYIEKNQIQYFVWTLLKYITQDMTINTNIDEVEYSCPLSERRQALENGQTIKVTIIQKCRYKKNFRLHFRIEKDAEQEGQKPFVQIHERISEYYQLGDVMSVKKSYNEALGINLYHLVPQITPVEDRMSKLDNGEMIFVNIEDVTESDEVKAFGFKSGENNYMYAQIQKSNKNGIRYYANASVGDIIFVIKDNQCLCPFGLYPLTSQ